MQFKKFLSPNNDTIFISSTSGHGATIGPEPISIPEILWKEAYAAGAISEDMKSTAMADYISQKKQEKEAEEQEEFEFYKQKLRELKENPVGVLNEKGDLVHRKAIAFIGKPIKRDLLDQLWSEIVSESEV